MKTLLRLLARNTSILSERGRWLARAGFWAGLIGLEISLVFAHRSAHNYFVAMLQPLRFFHVVYILFLLLLGGMLGGIFLKRNAVRWAATCLTLGALMFFVQIQTFPHSSHIELPGRAPANDWERGFTWIRNNTPADATFALDWKYIDSPGEDSQIFRAIAERSVVPDYIKDGGIAAVDPALTPQWTAGRAIQAGLATLGDAGRRAHLAQAHIRWLVLPYTAATSFDCPYENGTMKVCRIP